MLKPGWIGRPTNWICPVGGWNLLPSQGWKTHGNLPGRSGASFSIPAVRSRVFLGQVYTAPPASKCLTQNVFLLDELSYQDMQQQPFLLTVAHAQGLQYWVERLNLPVDPDFLLLGKECPRVERESEGAHGLFQKRCYPGLGKD